jgi:hypothetical protein
MFANRSNMPLVAQKSLFRHRAQTPQEARSGGGGPDGSQLRGLQGVAGPRGLGRGQGQGRGRHLSRLARTPPRPLLWCGRPRDTAPCLVGPPHGYGERGGGGRPVWGEGGGALLPTGARQDAVGGRFWRFRQPFGGHCQCSICSDPRIGWSDGSLRGLRRRFGLNPLRSNC